MLPIYSLLMVLASLALFEVLDARACSKGCPNCDDGICRSESECFYGWHGQDCNFDCQNCWTGGCNRSSGICHQCMPGRYMEDCAIPCPENCRSDRNDEVYCEREDGKCQNGCKEGWWGDTCNLLCSEHCDGACLQNNGHCIGDCIVGWWGPSCDKRCSENCLSGSCQSLTGKCICKSGFSGNFCNKAHVHNCFDSRYNVSDVSLVCTNGCKPGYTSPACNHKCGNNCLSCYQFNQTCELCRPPLFGDSCQVECGETCKEYACDLHGKCLNGCTTGFKGDKCDKPCAVNCSECHQVGDGCTQCKVGLSGKFCDEGLMIGKILPYISGTGQSDYSANRQWILLLSIRLALMREQHE